jgi:phage FluMu gp28-like protein
LFEVTVSDPEVFSDPVKWAETLLSHRGKPIKLYHFEKDYLRQTGHNLIVVKARQLGISWTTAIKALRIALHEPNVLIIFISLTDDQAGELMRHCIMMYNSLPDKINLAGTNFHVEKARIVGRGGVPTKSEMEFDNGSRIISLPNSPISVRGYRADYVFWDEAAGFPHEADMHAALDPTTSRGGLITYISTHRGTQTQFYEMSFKAKEGKLENHDYMEIPWTELARPEYMDDPEVKAYLKKIGELQRQYGEKSFFFLEEYCCIASDESVAMFTHEMLKDAIALWTKHGCEYRLPSGKGSVYVGLDIARVKDSTVLIAFEDLGEYVQVLGIWEWTNKPFPEQELLISKVLADIKPTLVRVDHNALGMDLSERLLTKFGSVIELIDFTNPLKNNLVLNSYVQMQDRKIAIPPDTINDFKAHQLYVQLHNVRRERSERSTSIVYVQADATMHDDYAWAFMLGASCLVSPLPHTVMASIGEDTKSIFSLDEGLHKSVVDIENRIPLNLGLTGKDQLEADEKERKKKEREWLSPKGPPPKRIECPECAKASRKTDKGETPFMTLQAEKSYTAEYVCETCWCTYLKVRK